MKSLRCCFLFLKKGAERRKWRFIKERELEKGRVKGRTSRDDSYEGPRR